MERFGELAKMKHTIELILKQLHIPKKGNILKVLLCLKNKTFNDIDLLNNFGPFIHYVRRGDDGDGVSDSAQAYENAVRLYRRISIIAIDRRRRRRGKSIETTTMGSDPFSITITGKSRFKKPHFFFLKSRVV